MDDLRTGLTSPSAPEALRRERAQAPAGDIPFEQATKCEAVVNLKAARTLGLALPLGLSAQAAKGIE